MAGNLVVSDVSVSDALAAYISSTGWAFGQAAHLFQNNFAPVPSSTLGSFTEATYSGYAPQSITYGTQFQVAPGQYALTSSPVLFPGNTGGASQTLYGVYVTDAGVTKLLYSWAFAAPVTMNSGDPDLIAQVVYDAWAAILL